MWKTMIFAAVGMGLLAQPAMADTVVMKCTITAGDTQGIISRTEIFKIGDGEWLTWWEKEGSWYDQCHALGSIIVGVDPGNTVKCYFSANQYRINAAAGSGFILSQLVIDRQTGRISTGVVIPSQGQFEATGMCERSTEPTPPPRPPAKL